MVGLDCAEHSAGKDGKDHAASQLFVSAYDKNNMKHQHEQEIKFICNRI